MVIDDLDDEPRSRAKRARSEDSDGELGGEDSQMDEEEEATPNQPKKRAPSVAASSVSYDLDTKKKGAVPDLNMPGSTIGSLGKSPVIVKVRPRMKQA